MYRKSRVAVFPILPVRPTYAQYNINIYIYMYNKVNDPPKDRIVSVLYDIYVYMCMFNAVARRSFWCPYRTKKTMSDNPSELTTTHARPCNRDYFVIRVWIGVRIAYWLLRRRRRKIYNIPPWERNVREV